MLTLMIFAPRPGKCPNGCPTGVKTTFGIWENINLLTFLCSVQGEVYCDRTRWFRIDDLEVKRNFRTARCGDLAGRAQRVAHRPELCQRFRKAPLRLKAKLFPLNPVCYPSGRTSFLQISGES